VDAGLKLTAVVKRVPKAIAKILPVLAKVTDDDEKRRRRSETLAVEVQVGGNFSKLPRAGDPPPSNERRHLWLERVSNCNMWLDWVWRLST
jgi:hypothetical protein